MSYFTTGGPGKEHRTLKPPPPGRIWERSKGDATHPVSSQNPPHRRPPWLRDAGATRKAPESEWPPRDHPESDPITIKPESVSPRGASSWAPLPSGSPLLGRPFPVRSLALAACVSPREIHSQMLDKSPLSGPERGPVSATQRVPSGIIKFVTRKLMSVSWNLPIHFSFETNVWTAPLCLKNSGLQEAWNNFYLSRFKRFIQDSSTGM